MIRAEKTSIAVWAITPNGKKLADTISQSMSDVYLFCSENISPTGQKDKKFRSLADTVRTEFHNFKGHIFITSTGIAVRIIAPLIRSKTEDPAVVVVDDLGKNAISLLSGHIGGANDLTKKISQIIGAHAVITTATDVNRITAIDVLAKEKKLLIENPQAIKSVNMAMLLGQRVYFHDPFGILGNLQPHSASWSYDDARKHIPIDGWIKLAEGVSGVYVDDVRRDLPENVLILRPASLVAGIGCNRNIEMEEMQAFLEKVLETYNLASTSLKGIASIDVKADESGLIALAEHLDLPLIFFNRQELAQVSEIKNPSTVVEKYVGVKSVCEAAAILATRNGTLIVPKQSTQNVTVAIARINFSL